MRLVLYQPDIPQNAGAMMRLAACLGVAVDLIEPCGFVLDDRRMRRAGMDYVGHLDLSRWQSWDAYVAGSHAGRLILLTTAATTRHVDFGFAGDDRLMVGRESAGVPELVHHTADARLVIPIRWATRSLNVATAAAIVLAEALRQTDAWPR